MFDYVYLPAVTSTFFFKVGYDTPFALMDNLFSVANSFFFIFELF